MECPSTDLLYATDKLSLYEDIFSFRVFFLSFKSTFAHFSIKINLSEDKYFTQSTEDKILKRKK